MEFRSTNDNGFVHFQGDVISNVSSGQGINSSHGVHLTGGSTGGVVAAAGDEASIALNVRAKGPAGVLNLGTSTGGGVNIVSTGALNLGTGSTAVSLGSTLVTIGSTTGQVRFGGSTAPFTGFIRFTSTAVATPNFNSTNAMVIESSVTITGVNSSHFVLANYVNNGIASTDMTIANVRTTSTTGEVLIAFEKHSTVTVAASTATISFLVFRF